MNKIGRGPKYYQVKTLSDELVNFTLSIIGGCVAIIIIIWIVEGIAS